MARQRTTRTEESRPAVERRHPQAAYKGRLFVDKERIPKGTTYAWVRESFLNQPDDNNMVDRMVQGWKAVPADRHPELVPPPLPGREHEKASLIRRGGLILMELPTAIFKEIQEQKREENADIMNSIAWTAGELNDDPRMPFTQDKDSIVNVQQVTAQRGPRARGQQEFKD